MRKLPDVIVIDKQMFQKDSFKRPLCLNSKICIGPAPTLKEMLAFFIVTILFEINIDDGMIEIKSKFKMNIDIIHHRLY